VKINPKGSAMRRFSDNSEEPDNPIDLGLLKAIETFDPAKRYKFSDYATGWISKAISQAIVDRSKLPRERD
jgi:hypothetical protein